MISDKMDQVTLNRRYNPTPRTDEVADEKFKDGLNIP